MGIDKLNLPIIKKKIPPAKPLSMEDYLKFVNLHLKYTLDRKRKRGSKRPPAVNVPFVLKG